MRKRDPDPCPDDEMTVEFGNSEIVVGSREKVLGATPERRTKMIQRAARDEEAFATRGQASIRIN